MSEQRSVACSVAEANVLQETASSSIAKNAEIYGGKWWLLLSVLCLGWFMSALDTTVVNIALKNIAEDLQADVAGLQWIVDGYSLVFASLLLSAGSLGDRLGNKRIYLLGLALFTVSSLLCGLAPAYWVLLLARILQGGGAALMVPNTLALINMVFPGSKQRTRAVAFWAMTGSGALAIGPVIGGLLVGLFDWRSIFFVNVPIGIVALLASLSPRRIPEAGRRLAKRGLDLIAQIMAVLGLGALAFVLIEGAHLGWLSWPVLACLALFVIAGASFCYVRRADAIQCYLCAFLPFQPFRR
ncbi:MFS transporter [Ktedonosporobacter rubrisoli]|uniref:MFS transporter n=1 Tax=Ktedonosporobacter rubrisoli TaxID=2509675 RepID=A0A4P6JN87_KTERU|nr:MFS transporter [Ktedonosporobacter rubrisoli]QBD76623.1 MFS transporter [Ktedonosporobacter rubrisoli]